MSESLSKLQSYVALSSTGEQLSKIQGYAVLFGNIVAISKLQGYAVLAPISGFTKALSDPSVTISDTLSAISHSTKSYSDTVLSTDSLSAGSAHGSASYSDTVTSTDTLSPGTVHVTVSYSDTVTATDHLTDAYGASKSYTDTATATDNLSHTFSSPVTLTDSVASSDSLAGAGIFSTGLLDSVVSSDNSGPLTFTADRVNSSDIYSITATTLSLVDTVQSSDFVGFVQPSFDGTVRLSIVSSGSLQATVFDGIVRLALITDSNSNAAQDVFDGLVRTVLGQYLPPVGPIPIFPTLPEGFPVKVTPNMDTIVGTTKSLRELRAPLQSYPLWDIELVFEELRDQTQDIQVYPPFVGFQQFMDLAQLWLSMYGRAGVFAFDCPWDNSRENQIIGVGNGQTYVFTIYRVWGLGAQSTFDPIGVINTIFEVKLDGVVMPSNQYYAERNKIYFVGPDGFIRPPGLGQEITMTFSYYYLCQFVEDEQDFEEFSKNRWTVPSLKFQAVIWP